MSQRRSQGAGEIPTAALAAALGAFEMRDEALVLSPAPGIGLAGSGPRTAACAGVDGEGRAVVALRASGSESVLAAIDALAWCDARGDLLARRVRASSELSPCVALIVDEPTPGTLAALATLRPDDLRVFELRTVSTSRGTETDLVEIRPARGETVGDAREAWDEGLDPASQALVERVRDGIARIDPDARPAFSARTILWRRGSSTLVALRTARDGLEAEVGGARFEFDESGVERVLEHAVRALCTGVDVDRDGAPCAEPPIALMPTGPLLSEDELAMLRG